MSHADAFKARLAVSTPSQPPPQESPIPSMSPPQETSNEPQVPRLTPTARRVLLFAPRAGPAPHALMLAGRKYGELVRTFRMDNVAPAAQVSEVEKLLDVCLKRLDGPGKPPATDVDNLGPTDPDRVTWDAAALLYGHLCEWLTKAWRSGGDIRLAVEHN